MKPFAMPLSTDGTCNFRNPPTAGPTDAPIPQHASITD